MPKKCTPSKKVRNAAKTLSTSKSKLAKSKAGSTLAKHKHQKHN